MFLLHDFSSQRLRQSAFSSLLEDLFIKLFLLTVALDYEYRGRKTPRECLRPPHHILLHHEEQSLRIHLISVHFGLQPPVLGAPRHGLALDSVRPELHETLVERVEYGFVVNVQTLLHDGVLKRRVLQELLLFAPL